MNTCSRCGADNAETSRFCATCGTALTAAQAAAEPAPEAVAEPGVEAPQAARTVVIPPAAPAGATGPAAPTIPQIDWRGLLSGNWVGAAVTAATILVVAGVFSLVLVILAKPANFGVDNSLTLVMSVLASAFGADFVAHASVDEETIKASLGLFPLLVSLVTAAAGIIVFRRVTAAYPRGTAALADAARVALLVAIPLLIGSLVFRSDTDNVGRGWAADLMSLIGAKVSFGAWPASSFFLGFLSVFAVLALACFLRRDWWGTQVQRVHDWVAAPLKGSLVLLGLLPVAGAIGLGLLLVAGDSNTSELENADDWMAAIAAVVGLLANGGMWLLAVGTGASYGTGGTADGQTESEMARLATLTDHEPAIWAAPLVVVAVLFVAAFVVARRSAEPAQILRNLALWVGSLFLTLPVLLRLTTIHGSYSSSGEFGESRGHGFVGPDGFETVFFMVGIALLCALVVAKMSNALTLDDVRRQLSKLGQFQSTPAQQPVPVDDETEQP